MIKKLFTQIVPVALLAVFSSIGNSYATSTTITTTFTNSPGHTLVTNIATPQFITFLVTNNNTCPITITDLSWYHVGSNTYGAGPVFTHSMNGANYTLWYYTAGPQLSGAPTITTTAGWKIAGTGGPISNGTSTGSIIPIINAMNVSIPPGATYRFALSATDTLSFFSNAAPATFTNNGVTVNATSLGGTYWGAMPGPGQNIVSGLQPAFCGSITFQDAGSAAPAPPTVTASKTTVCRIDQSTLNVIVPPYMTNKVIKIYYPDGSLAYSGPLTSYVMNFGVDPKAVGGDWTVSVTDPNCGNIESARTKITIIRLLPAPPQLDGKTQFCINEPFTPVNVIGSNPKWYYTASGGSPIPFTPPFNTTWAHKDTFYVSQTISGCESEFRTMVAYSAAPQPAPPIASTPIFYCENSPAVEVNAKGQNLRWYYQPTGGLSSVVPPVPNTTAKDSFFYWVSQTQDGCESARQPITVIVTFRPNGLILTSRNELCQGDTMTVGYYGSAFPGSGYNWTFPNGTQILAGDFKGPLYLQLDSAGIMPIKLQVGHSNCYSEIYSKTLTIDTLPTAVIEARPNICQGQTELISLSDFTASTDSFFWDFYGGYTTFFSTDQGPYGVIWEVPGKKAVSVRLVNKLCSATYIDTVNVHPKPDAGFKIDPNGLGTSEVFDPIKKYCNGDSMLMTANTVVQSSTYSWYPARFFDNYSGLSSAWGRIDFQGFVKLSVTDEYGCMNTDSIFVKTQKCCEVYFPSAFTPNNDGRNDLFRMVPTSQGLNAAKGVQRNIQLRSLKVVNRWGHIVFETADRNAGWDGKVNGKEADLGNYAYYINYTCDGTTYEQKGEFVLVR